MDSIIRNLNNAQWNQEFAGYLKNIKQLRSHILYWRLQLAEKIWSIQGFSIYKRSPF
jgi:hypothetical protein